LLSETVGNVQVPAETLKAGPFDEEEERTEDG
jgi:hypothetical protein